MPTARPATARLILLERSGEWAVAWKRLLRGTAIGIVETRTLSQSGEVLAESPASVVALELTPDSVPATVKALADWSRSFPRARFVVLSWRGGEAYEELAREAGALHVAYSPAQLARIAPLVRRHIARAPRPEMSLRETILSRLPWASHATTG